MSQKLLKIKEPKHLRQLQQYHIQIDRVSPWMIFETKGTHKQKSLSSHYYLEQSVWMVMICRWFVLKLWMLWLMTLGSKIVYNRNRIDFGRISVLLKLWTPFVFRFRFQPKQNLVSVANQDMISALANCILSVIGIMFHKKSNISYKTIIESYKVCLEMFFLAFLSCQEFL